MIKRHDAPPEPVNPYPDAPTEVAGFRYDSALVLLRLKDAVRMRNGEDADYLLGRPFLASWQDPDGVWIPLAVPQGLITDLTSVPRLFRFLIGRVGPWLEAAIIHDYLYIAWQDVSGRGPNEQDRRFADNIMRAAMQAAKVGPLRIWAIFAALRLFGGPGYRRGAQERFVDICDPDITCQLAPQTAGHGQCYISRS